MYQNYYAQPSYGSQTYAQPPVANGYHQLPQASYPVDPTTFRRDFSNRLSELTMNSRPIIQSLSMYAHDYVRFAEIVAQCLETHIRRVSVFSVGLWILTLPITLDQHVVHGCRYASGFKFTITAFRYHVFSCSLS